LGDFLWKQRQRSCVKSATDGGKITHRWHRKKKTFTGVIYRRSKFSCNSCPSDDYYYASKLQP
jgi:hypothetical protein